MQHAMAEQSLGIAADHRSHGRVARKVKELGRIVLEVLQQRRLRGEMDVFVLMVAEDIHRSLIAGELEMALGALRVRGAEIEFPEHRIAPGFRLRPGQPRQQR